MNSVTAREGETVEAMVRRHQSSIRGYLVFVGCPTAMLDDVLQETFLSLLRGPFEQRDEASTRAYLRRVARNLFLKSLERNRREVATVELEDAEALWVQRWDDDDGRTYLDALRACLEGLPKRSRSILELRYAGSVSRVEVGRRFGLTEAGVKSILVRTKEALRECVGRRLGQ